MAYCYVLDVEISEGKFEEAKEIVRTIKQQYNSLGANLEVYTPLSGNVHRIFAIFRFDTFAEFEELEKRAGKWEEHLKSERRLHSIMKRPISDLYTTLE